MVNIKTLGGLRINGAKNLSHKQSQGKQSDIAATTLLVTGGAGT